MNTIQDLNMVLHQQLERLDNPDITKEELDMEATRTQALVDVSEQIVKVNSLALNIMKASNDGFVYESEARLLIGDSNA